MKKLLIGCMAAVAALIAFSGCDQDKVVYSGPNYLMFSDTLYTYAVQETNEIFNVPVSATVPADYDRTFGVEVIDKESNAVEGKHYKILSNTVTIKAGEMSTDVKVQGYCKVTSSYLSSDYYPKKVDLRLVTSDIVEGKENTIVVHGLYFDGYDMEIKFNRKDVLEPLVEMEEQICGSTGEAFNTIHGDGKLRLNQPTAYLV